jgi:WD40 repeat protein/transcriptional regulator with XRE-family HTH domain
MRGSSYREPDYDFGKTMLTLRTKIGLTQAALAERLGVTRHAIGGWEAGSSYPQAEHLKQFIQLAIQSQAFDAEHWMEEARAFWRSAHQKVLFDEIWLASVAHLAEAAAAPGGKATSRTEPGPRLDWNDALAVPTFFGREWEMDLLTGWVVVERCRLVSVLGLGGIGKTVFAIHLMHQLAEHFQIIMWRSLRDLPTCEALLADLLSVLAPQAFQGEPGSVEQRQGIILDQMRSSRILLVLDGLEAALEEGEGASGRLRAGFEGFERFLRLAAETEHQSCVLLTSREKPSILVSMEGLQAPVRVLRLGRLDTTHCEKLLAEKALRGSDPDRAELIEAYAGNPMALKIAAQTIVDLFEGEVGLFLKQGEVIFGGVRDLLDEQFARTSQLEQAVLVWLAILREPATLDDLLETQVAPVTRARILEALDSLYRHSLIEHGQKKGSFALQSMVLEYLTDWLITQICAEIKEDQLDCLIEYSLELASAREDVRQAQERLIVSPILANLNSIFSPPAGLEDHLLGLLSDMAAGSIEPQGYGPANLVTLLRLQRGDLRGLDLSRLVLRRAFLQGIDMQDANLSDAVLQESVFSETFDAINGVAISPSGEYWAAISRSGEIRLWRAGGRVLNRIWQAHTDRAWSLAFNADGQLLASGGWDGMIKLWRVESGELLWSASHTGNINRVAFSPAGDRVASGGAREAIVWDVASGAPVQSLAHPHLVLSLTWSPRGNLLATGDAEGQIRLWEVRSDGTAACAATISGHSGVISELAFAPDGGLLASAGFDHTVKLWDVTQRDLRATLTGHVERVHRLAWSPDGRFLASGGLDKTIWLWDVNAGRYHGVLPGHSDAILALAFTPDSRSLLSSGDNSLREWEISSGRCMRVLRGSVVALYDIDWSPDGKTVVSGGSDKLLAVAGIDHGAPARIFPGHDGLISGVGWNPDGRRLASSSWDATIRLWDLSAAEHHQMLELADSPVTFFNGIAWSPDGRRLASPTYLNPQGILVWDVDQGTHFWLGPEEQTAIRRVAWSPDGRRLAGGGENGDVNLWDTTDGALLQQFCGHQGSVKDVAWRPDGKRLASTGGSADHGELYVWDLDHPEQVNSFQGVSGVVYAIAWGSNGEQLISGGSDGALRWWDVERGECVHIRQAHQGTVQAIKQSPDGSSLASCGDDGVVMVWDLQTGEHLQSLRRDRPYERLKITGIRGMTEAQKETLLGLGALDEPDNSG